MAMGLKIAFVLAKGIVFAVFLFMILAGCVAGMVATIFMMFLPPAISTLTQLSQL